MRKAKLPKPIGVCDVCGAFTGTRMNVNHRCSRVIYGRRCPGKLKADLSHVWDACQSCHATGELGSENCVDCGGWGWHLMG